MHELSIAMSIVDIACEYAKKESAKTITEIEIELGSLSGVVYESLAFALEAATKNTIAEMAQFAINYVQAEADCLHCNTEFSPENFYAACPNCAQFGFNLKKGKELRVKSIQIE